MSQQHQETKQKQLSGAVREPGESKSNVFFDLKNPKSKNLLVVLFTIFLDVFGFSLLIPVLPLLLLDKTSSFYILDQSFEVSTANLLYGFLTGIFPLVSFFAAPILGQLSDKYGRKNILLGSLLGTFLSYSLLAFGIITRNIGIIILSRITGGIASGNVSVAHTVIADVSESSEKNSNFGWSAAVYGLGIILGSYIGGQLSSSSLVSWFNASTPFVFASIISLINLGLAYFLLQESNKFIQSNLVIKKFQSTISTFLALIRPSNYRNILIVSFLFQAGFTFVTTFVSVYFVHKLSWNAGDIGNFFGLAGIFIALTQLAMAKGLLKKFSNSSLLKTSIIGTAFTVIYLLFPSNTWQVFGIVPFFSFFSFLCLTNITSEISNSTSQTNQGEVLGLNSGFQNLAQAIPPLFAGLLAYIIESGSSNAKIPFYLTNSQLIIDSIPLVLAFLTMLLAWWIYTFRTHTEHYDNNINPREL